MLELLDGDLYELSMLFVRTISPIEDDVDWEFLKQIHDKIRDYNVDAMLRKVKDCGGYNPDAR